MASSSSTDFSRPRPKNGFYDVFLNFRGEDTRRGFTNNLYVSLMQNKVHSFLDSSELMGRTIKDLFKFIGRSKIAVVVYSERYASSQWCLRELEAIMQRVNDKEMVVVPIFYKVEVGELKHLTGNTGKYLEELISEYGETRVQKWKDAITSLGNISGLTYKDTDSRNEHDFISEITQKIKGKLADQRDEEGELVKTMVEDVMEKLKDDKLQTLSYQRKYILLNMACFWTGKLKYAPTYVWEDHFNGSVSSAIELLRLSSFITTEDEDDDTYEMDDQLRDLARATIGEYYNDQGKQVWIWRSEEAANLLRENKLLPQVEAICLNGAQLYGTEKCIGDEQLRNLPNLRFIKIKHANIAGNFEGALRKVSYLKVAADPFMHTIQNLSLENIVVLDLSGSRVGDDWRWSTMKIASKMKDLNLSRCHQLKRGPNFSLFPNLERLDVDGCDQLESMDVSKLLKLKDLDASNCESLKNVYGLDRLVNGRRLTWMEISGSEAIEMSTDLKSKLKSLKILEST